MPSIELWVVCWLLDVSIKVALSALAAGAGMAVCRARSASVRHRVWLLVLVGMLLLPALVHLAPAVSLPGWLYPALQSAAVAEEADGGTATATARQPVADGLAAPVAPEPRPRFPSAELRPAAHVPHAASQRMVSESPRDTAAVGLPEQQVRETPKLPASTFPPAAPIVAQRNGFALAVVCVYLAGAVSLMIRLLVGVLRTSRLVRRARPIELPSKTTWPPTGAKVAESDAVRVSVTIGYWRPMVVLPTDWRTWSASLLTSVLAHEAEHVRRRDTWVALLAAVNCVVYWFHPAAWIVRRRLTDLAERVCDDEVIRATDNRSDYAQNLLQMAGRLTPVSGRLRSVGVAMARKANVVKRIEAIIDDDRPLSRRIGVTGALLLLCVAAPLVLLAAGLRSTAPTVAAEAETASSRRENAGGVAETESSATGIKGRVVLAGGGKPVANAEVWLLTQKSRRVDRNMATTDEQGGFEFTGLPEGRHALVAFYQNLSSRSERYKGYKAEPGDVSIVLELREAPSLKVRVVTRAEGRAIEGATVRLLWTEAERDHLTDANGEVVIRGLTSEVWTVETRAKGFAKDEQAVNLYGTDMASVTTELDRGVELFGVVRDEAGEALADVEIDVRRSDHTGEQDYLVTDADGSYRFEHLPIAGFRLWLSKEGYSNVQSKVVITAPPGGQQKLNLTLPRRPDGGSVQGTVVDADGKPVEGASVVNGDSSTRDFRETITDDQGRYRLDDVYKGLHGHGLFFKARGFSPKHLEFTPGSREHPAEVNATLVVGHRIRGRVVDEQGEALPGVYVYYGRGDRYDLGGRAATDAEGRFEFDSLPTESAFTFLKGGYSEMRNVMLPLDGAEEVIVTMQTAGVIRGLVVGDETGEPLLSFTVRVTRSPDRRPDDPFGGLSGARAFGGEKFTTRDGMFHLGEFVRGMPLQVIVEADGRDPAVARRVVAVADGDAEPVEFRLAPLDESSLLAIAGRLVDEQTKPLAGAELRLIVSSKRPFRRDRFRFDNWQLIRSGRVRIAPSDSVLQHLGAITDADGRFKFDQVRPSGEIELVYWGEGVAPGRRRRLERLSREELSDLTITSETPGVVRGAIDVEAYPGISQITLSGSFGSHDAEVSEGEDFYEVRDVPEGRYQLQVYGPLQRRESWEGRFGSDLIKRIPVEVKSGEIVTIDLGFKSEETLQPAKDSEKATAEEPSAPDPGPAAAKPSDDGPMARTKAPPTRQRSPKDEGSVIVIVGNVRDESGNGVRGARLWLPLKREDDERLAKATTTETGAFTLRVPAAWTAPGAFTPSWTIWCHAQDHQIASASAYKQLKRQSNSPIEIVLKPSTDTGFEVKDVAGVPIAGTRVEPTHFLTGVHVYDIIPRQLREMIAEETDEDGRVLFPEMGRDGFSSVQVTAEGYGIQHLRLRDSATEPAMRTITLRPCGRLEGQLALDDKTAIKSARVRVSTAIQSFRVRVSQERFLAEHTSGNASAEVDEDGRFVVPAVAEGRIRLSVTVDRSLALRPRIREGFEIYAGETTRMEVPFERTVRVRGRVETKADGAPVAGGLVSVQYGSFRRSGQWAPTTIQSDLVRTDADGRFETNVLAGDVRRQLIMRPTEYADWIVESADWRTPIDVPAGVETFDLPPLELIATSKRSGRLVNRSNRPIAGARIRASSGNRVYAVGETDESGAFTLRLPEGFETEEHDVSRSRETGPTVATVISESPLVLQIPD